MQTRDLVVVGASAGGVEALMKLVSGLTPTLPAAVLVVLHVPADATSHLPEILRRVGQLPARHARDGDRVEPGVVLIAPPDMHMLVEDGRVRVASGPRENRHRPAIDPLFRSAAHEHGERVIGLLLSGVRGDGVAGMHAVKAHGGLTLIQDPADAIFADMPAAVQEAVEVDHVEPSGALGPLVERLVREGTVPMHGSPATTDGEEVTMSTTGATAVYEPAGPAAPASTPSGYGCPECGGVLWELREGPVLRFRCRVGHAYSDDALFDAQETTLESALWSAVRALEERADLSRRLAGRHESLGRQRLTDRYARQADEADENGRAIRDLLLRSGIGEGNGVEEGGVGERAVAQGRAGG